MTLRTLFFTLFFALSGFALEIDPARFQSEVQRIAGKFPEFTYLKETAEKYGLKVYLFGGSASSFAHYVKENMLLEKGERNYYSYHFQESEGVRDITNVFRPTQDIDLVVDGTLENIKEFEREVLGHLPSLRGDSKSWEVRSLREDYGDKMALLHSFDFLNQHTDSHSVGLVALSDVGEDQVVRDLRDWDTDSPRFLKDVLEGKLHYYYGESHHLTSRAQAGKNPPIFSVIRYFIKLFQHELTPHPEDREKIKAIIANFEPRKIKGGYTRDWLFKNIPKLFLQSKDVELSWNTLEEFDLREKLSQLGDISNQGDPAWWMNKSPLRSFELGQGRGKTASELGIKTVAHDTRDFYLWTVITASKKGRANMFESRQGTAGESAAYGRGVYTVKNSRKGWGNGFTIRFKMNPLAREGVDFKIINDIVLILNRNALEVIPDSIEVASLMDYLQLVKESNGQQSALLERLRIKIDRHYYMNRDKPEIKKEIKKAIKFFKKNQDNENLWQYFSNLRITKPLVEELIDLAITLKNHEILTYIARYAFFRPHSKDMGVLIEKTIEGAVTLKSSGPLNFLAQDIFSKPHTKNMNKLIEKLIKASVTLNNRYSLSYLAQYTFSKPHSKDMGALIEKTIEGAVTLKDTMTLIYLAQDTFSQPHIKDMRKLIEKTIEGAVTLKSSGPLFYLSEYVFSKPHTKDMEKVIEKLIEAAITLKNSGPLFYLSEYVFSKPHTKDMEKVIEKIIKAAITLKNSEPLFYLAQDTFSQPHTKDMGKIIEKLIKAAVTLKDSEPLIHLAQDTFSQPHTKDMGKLIEKLIEAAVTLKSSHSLNYLAQYTFSQPHTKDMNKLIEKLIKATITLKNNEPLNFLAIHTFSRPHTKDMNELIEKLIKASVILKNNELLSYLATNTFSKPHTKDMNKLIEKLIKASVTLKDSKSLRYLATHTHTFSQPHTKHMKPLIDLVTKFNRDQNWQELEVGLSHLSRNHKVRVRPVGECIDRLYLLLSPRI